MIATRETVIRTFRRQGFDFGKQFGNCFLLTRRVVRATSRRFGVASVPGDCTCNCTCVPSARLTGASGRKTPSENTAGIV